MSEHRNSPKSFHRVARINFAVAATFILYFVGIFQVIEDKLAEKHLAVDFSFAIQLPTYLDVMWLALFFCALGIPLAVMGGFLAETAAHWLEDDDPHPKAEIWSVRLCEVSGAGLFICTGALFYAMNWVLGIAFLVVALAVLILMSVIAKPLKGEAGAE